MNTIDARPRWRTAFPVLLLLGTLGAQAPRELGFEAGEPGAQPPGWTVRSEQFWQAGLTEDRAAAGNRSLRLQPRPDAVGPDQNGFGNVMTSLPAADYRGRRVGLRASLFVEGQGKAQMWLRIDLPNDGLGAFDNMSDRPVRRGGWQEAVIELDVADDAESLVFGFLSLGDATVCIDAVSLAVIGDAAAVQDATSAPLQPRERDNLIAATRLFGHLRFFHPDPAAVQCKQWNHFAVGLMEAAAPATDAQDLARRLAQVIAPVAPTVKVWAGAAADAPPLPPPPTDASHLWSWRHNGAGRVANPGSVYTSKVEKRALEQPLTAAEHAANQLVLDLGGGVCARVALRVPFAATAAGDAAPIDATWNQPGSPVLDARNRNTRFAAIATAWTVMEHFYPYFDCVDVDWNAALAAGLADAADDQDPTEFLSTLRALMAKLQDGHGFVTGPGRSFGTLLPVQVAWASGDLVVVGVAEEARAELRVGDVITAIDGRAVEEVYRELATTIPAATEGFRRHVSEGSFHAELRTADPVCLQVRDQTGAGRAVTVARARNRVADQRPARPANGAELAPGIVYFQLDHADDKALAAVLPALAAARGVVIDLRGYPGSAGITLLRHLIREQSTSPRWGIPLVTKPGRENWRWNEPAGWNLEPEEPRIGGKVAFLTDGRAVSYAESVMGIVEAYQLGAIVGSTTAGTNGNINPFVVPGNYRVSWTGMRVQKHDGSRHHGVGIAPTVPVEPTAAGIAAGQDEVLLRAIAVLQQQLGS